MISKRLVDPLALGLLKGEFAAGDHIEVDADDGDLVFSAGVPLRLLEALPHPDDHALRVGRRVR